MSSPLNICAVIFAQDVPKMRNFYLATFSMECRIDQANFALLTLPSFELVIHGIPHDPTSVSLQTDATVVRKDASIKLCLPVRSINAARAVACNFGGFIKEAEHEWSYEGIVACDGHDPEGNVFQVRSAAP